MFVILWNVEGEAHARCALLTDEELKPFAQQVAESAGVVDGSIMVGTFKEVPSQVRPPRMVPAEVIIGAGGGIAVEAVPVSEEARETLLRGPRLPSDGFPAAGRKGNGKKKAPATSTEITEKQAAEPAGLFTEPR